MPDTPPDFQAFLASIAPLTVEQRYEAVLSFGASALNYMDDQSIRELSGTFAVMFPGTPEQSVMLELLEGHLALRALALEPPD